MPSITNPKLTEALGEILQPLVGAAEDYDRLIDLVGDARFVLLGEASHGTQEFYRERAEVTTRLIQESGRTAPDTHWSPTRCRRQTVSSLRNRTSAKPKTWATSHSWCYFPDSCPKNQLSLCGFFNSHGRLTNSDQIAGHSLRKKTSVYLGSQVTFHYPVRAGQVVWSLRCCSPD